MALNNSLIGNLDVAGTLTQSSVQVLTSGAVASTLALTVTSASANALAVGLAGTTNPALNVDASTASSATGINIKSAAAAAGVAVSALSSGSAENLTIDAKGTGTLTLNGTATGAITLGRATTLSAGVLTLPNGAVGAPAINFGDATSGIYRSGLNTLSIVTAGNQAIQINSLQQTSFIAAVIFPVVNTNTGASYTVLSTDVYLIANASGTQTLTLGTATAGRRLVVRTIAAQTVVSASSNVVPSAGGAAGTAILAATAGKWAELVGDGTNWQIMAAN